MVYDTSQAAFGTDVPIGVLSTEIFEPTINTNFGIRYIASGSVRLEELTAFNPSDLPLTATALDALRSVGIIPIGTNELLELDNQ